MYCWQSYIIFQWRIYVWVELLLFRYLFIYAYTQSHRFCLYIFMRCSRSLLINFPWNKCPVIYWCTKVIHISYMFVFEMFQGQGLTHIFLPFPFQSTIHALIISKCEVLNNAIVLLKTIKKTFDIFLFIRIALMSLKLLKKYKTQRKSRQV